MSVDHSRYHVLYNLIPKEVFGRKRMRKRNIVFCGRAGLPEGVLDRAFL